MSGQQPQPATVRPASGADAADLAVFLGRAVRLDPAALVRLRLGAGRITAYLRLPFGVVVSRSAAGEGTPADVTLVAGELLAALDTVPVGQPITLPRRDREWRGALPPAGDWQRLDAVPAAVVRQLVRTGGETLRAAGPAAAAGAEGLLDHAALTVTGVGRTVVLPLRVLSAAWKMGFLGPEGGPGGPPVGGDVLGGIAAGPEAGQDTQPTPDPAPAGPEQIVVVSVAGGWARLAAPFGSAYHRVTPELGVLPG